MITAISQFPAIAKQYSEDLNSRDKGGALGTTIRGDDSPVLSADFENAVFTLPINTVSDPIRSPEGWHLIMVTKRQGLVDQSLKQLTAKLRASSKIHVFISN